MKRTNYIFSFILLVLLFVSACGSFKPKVQDSWFILTIKDELNPSPDAIRWEVDNAKNNYHSRISLNKDDEKEVRNYCRTHPTNDPPCKGSKVRDEVLVLLSRLSEEQVNHLKEVFSEVNLEELSKKYPSSTERCSPIGAYHFTLYDPKRIHLCWMEGELEHDKNLQKFSSTILDLKRKLELLPTPLKKKIQGS